MKKSPLISFLATQVRPQSSGIDNGKDQQLQRQFVCELLPRFVVSLHHVEC
jgi:hypothetical protein